MALLLLRDLTLIPAVAGALTPRQTEVFRGLLVVAANASQVWGTWLLARAWKVAALTLPASPSSQRLLTAAVVVVVVGVTGPGMLHNVARIQGGELAALAGLASGAGDAVALMLIAPLLLTALALRGGLFGWPFALLTASYLAWLLYDAALALGPAAGLDVAGARSLSELFRALGCLLGFSAGLAQRMLVVGLRRTGPVSEAA